MFAVQSLNLVKRHVLYAVFILWGLHVQLQYSQGQGVGCLLTR